MAKAIVTATIEQLEQMGISGDITGEEVEVYDIDKFNGIGGLCSRIVTKNRNEFLASKGYISDYLITTKLLKFI